MGKGTVVLAYSGGLDTSICIPLLKEEYGYDRVVTVAADVGQRKEEIAVAEEKGKRFADKHYTLDLIDEFVDRCLMPSIKANGLYEGYPMGTSLA
ncbi:MAG: argininosuccinate synthase, partial [Burkholderiales bacterium]|nr:argininosuccinate synthase [Burkholderiales bacterium]